jgi:hypothetical protein
VDLKEITNGMPIFVRGRDQAVGKPVASVDHLDAEKYIKLRRSDSPDGMHHWIPVSWIDSIRNGAIILNKSEVDFRRGLLNEFPEAEQKAVGY